MEKKFLSIYMFKDTTKNDLEYFNNKYPFKYKKDIVSLIILIIAIISIPFMFISYFTLIGTFVLFLALAYFRFKYLNRRGVTYLDALEREIKNEYKAYKAISAVYPIYLHYDNKEKEFYLDYLDKNFLACNYSDFNSYNIYIDNYKTKHNRLNNKPDRTAKSYKLELIFNDGKKLEIGFANINKYIRLHKSYEFLQYANTKTINELLDLIDRAKKGRI